MSIEVENFIVKLKRRQLCASYDIALGTANVLLRFIAGAKWPVGHPEVLIGELRTLGRRIIEAKSTELTSGNIVRRVLAIVRESIEGNTDNDPLMSSMFSLLTDVSNVSNDNNNNKSNNKINNNSNNNNNNNSTKDYSNKVRKADIIDGIHDLIDEISNISETIAGMSVDSIHENEILLVPTPASNTLQHFLIRAAQKRSFSVFVTESFPNNSSQSWIFARALAKVGIDTVVIPDSAVYALMPRVGKVLIGPQSVLANGGAVVSSGVQIVCQTAKEHKTPVIACTGVYKVSPAYPVDIESLIEAGNPNKIIPFSDSLIVQNVDVYNPLYDYLEPDLVDLYLTNLGGFPPSFMYRIVLDHYHPEDTVL